MTINRRPKKMNINQHKALLNEDLMKMVSQFKPNRLTIKEWGQLTAKLDKCKTSAEVDQFEEMLLDRI